MKLLALFALPLLAACTSSRHLAVTDASRSPDQGACSGPCQVEMRCLPNGNCLIVCIGPEGQRCEIELRCDGDECELVRCDGDPCCAANAGSKARD